jgi:hypothetical protein
MNIAELLDEFAVGEDVEVVVAALPELRTTALETLGRLVLEHVQGDREWVELGLAQEKVDVFRHQDVSEDVELMPGPKLFEFFEEGGSRAIVVKVRQSAVTTEGEEVIAT